MQRHPDDTRRRLRLLAADLKERIYPQRQPVDRLTVSGPHDRITFADAQNLKGFRKAKLGQQFGPPWATFWFRGQATVPPQWEGQRIDLIWLAHSSESTLWIGGKSIQGLNWNFAYRPDAVLTKSGLSRQKLSFQVEMACNHPFGASRPDTFAVQSISPHILDRCEIALFDQLAWDLYFDFSLLQELEAALSQDASSAEKAFAGELLFELNSFANTLRPDDRSTWEASRATLLRLFTRANGTIQHEMSAIGHAHIDTAWLWPIAETFRKCERTFSSQTTYMQSYPNYKFAASSAFQYQAVKERNRHLFERMKHFALKGQWIPVGGTWVEPDCNVPSGESLCRQFLYGQRFFQKEFGKRCTEFWNPDVFGYNGQLPQIMQLAGISRFLTQKLSWNRFNKPRFHTFFWEALDGSRVLTHFPPADTYGAEATVSDIRASAGKYKDHDRSKHSLYLFGYGDGGGGPTKPMLEVLSRCADLQGLPRTTMRSPSEFFDLLSADGKDIPRVVGELYLEYHRGTYTTHAAVKRGMRKLEFLLHDVECLAAIAHRLGAHVYPAAELERLWKLLLVNQFHDILPGSSIAEVYVDAMRYFDEIRRVGEQLRREALDALTEHLANGQGGREEWLPFNPLGVRRSEVCRMPEGKLAFVEAQGYGIGQLAPRPSPPFALRDDARGTIVLENGNLKALFGAGGDLLSLYDKRTQRQVLRGPGNRLQLHDDKPMDYDAWEVEPYHLETGRDCPAAESFFCRVDDLRAEIVWQRKIGDKSHLVQTARLDAGATRLEFHCDVDWHEDHRLLKVSFPVNVRAMNATYEMQFGCVERPTHFNTTYDLARFEVPGHKWSDLSEHRFGVALLSESKYGFSTFDNQLRMTLLRSPKDPDPNADMGKHRFAYALYPHAGSWQEGGVVAEAFRFNHPLVFGRSEGKVAPRSFVEVADGNLVLDTIKKAEDSADLILRFYESHGARGTAQVRVNLPYETAVYTNILEDAGAAVKLADGMLEITYEPFKIITVKLR